jgi:hypothetical protein
MRTILTTAVAAAFLAPLPLSAQHEMHHPAGRAEGAPMQGGQAAFAALSEIVKILEADPKTDWSKVDLEALRGHLIDMDAVTMRAKAVAQDIPGGARFDVTGDARTAPAIGRVLRTHAGVLEEMTAYRAVATEIPGGIRLTVTAKSPDDAATVAKIRGLGYAGLLVSGDHHAIHHLAIARGEGHEAHRR